MEHDFEAELIKAFEGRYAEQLKMTKNVKKKRKVSSRNEQRKDAPAEGRLLKEELHATGTAQQSSQNDEILDLSLPSSGSSQLFQETSQTEPLAQTEPLDVSFSTGLTRSPRDSRARQTCLVVSDSGTTHLTKLRAKDKVCLNRPKHQLKSSKARKEKGKIKAAAKKEMEKEKPTFLTRKE